MWEQDYNKPYAEQGSYTTRIMEREEQNRHSPTPVYIPSRAELDESEGWLRSLFRLIFGK